jgi:antitoxin CptB
MNELILLKNKIKYRSTYRGTKEMDLLLSSFVSKHIDNLTHIELKKLNDFMDCSDEDISNFYLNDNSIPNFSDKKILDLFRRHKI